VNETRSVADQSGSVTNPSSFVADPLRFASDPSHWVRNRSRFVANESRFLVNESRFAATQTHFETGEFCFAARSPCPSVSICGFASLCCADSAQPGRIPPSSDFGATSHGLDDFGYSLPGPLHTSAFAPLRRTGLWLMLCAPFNNFVCSAHFAVVASPTVGYVNEVVVTLPDDLAVLRGMDEREVRRELAVALYSGRKLTLVQAADLAGSGLFDFQALLRDRGIPQHYDQVDLDRDLLALRELPPK